MPNPNPNPDRNRNPIPNPDPNPNRNRNPNPIPNPNPNPSYAGPSLWRTFAMAALRYGGPRYQLQWVSRVPVAETPHTLSFLFPLLHSLGLE